MTAVLAGSGLLLDVKLEASCSAGTTVTVVGYGEPDEPEDWAVVMVNVLSPLPLAESTAGMLNVSPVTTTMSRTTVLVPLAQSLDVTAAAFPLGVPLSALK